MADKRKKKPEWDLSSKEYDGKEINVITFKDGKELTLPEIEHMFEKNKSAPEPVPSKTTSKVILNFLEERNPTREEFINYFSGKKLNKGGTTMKDQMSMFEEGGLKEEGGMVDEESGNDVPTGSTKEEVRDDIPAMLSEGEFVFPADVVRYHGLEKLMELRQEAKMGIKKMEAMGQMGNADEATLPDDIPFTVDDLIIVAEPMEAEDNKEPKEKAHGGVLHAAQGTYVQPTINSGIVGYQPSIYSQPPVYQPPSFNPPVYQPPSSIVPTQPTAPTTGYSPLYQTTPTPAVAPKFEADAVEFTGVDPDKYTDPTKIANEAVGSTGTTNVATTQTMRQAPAEDDGDKDMIRQLKNTADREKAQADYRQKQADLENGSADTLVQRWLDNKRVLGAGQTLLGLSPVIGGLTTAAGYRDQEQLEKALDDKYEGWREGKA